MIATQAEDALRGLADAELLAFCTRERRVLVSENVPDFMPLVHDLAVRGEAHYGVVFTSPSSMPRGHRTIGLFVEALDGLLRDHPTEDALRDQVRWLQSPPPRE